MNNLKLYSEISRNLQLQTDGECVLFTALDVERNRLFFASSANFIYTVHLSSFQDENAGPLLAELHTVDLDAGDSIASFDYLMEKEALLVGTANGVLLMHNPDENDCGTEVVGQVEGGVKAVSPSPDGDLLAVLNGFGELLVMTHDWDLLYENSVAESLPGQEGGSVVRGLSRSMFEGSISWRGDGKYFATLSGEGDSSSPKRLKVWERDSGALLATSDSKAFMGPVLDWMPSGAKIATVYDRRVEGICPEIVFYERNGLVRSSFGINEAMDVKLEILKWSNSSDLLASVVRCDQCDAVKVWFLSNNHWYLKHEIRYPKKDEVRFMWDPIKPLQLICWTLHGQVTIYNFIWNSAIMDNSTALVIDGSKILVTPLSLSLMPPPLHLFNLKFPSAVRDVSLYSKNSKNIVAAFLSDGCLGIAELPELGVWEELEGKEFTVENSISETVCGSFVHLMWLDPHILLAVSHYGFSHSNCGFNSLPDECQLQGFYVQEIELMCSEDRIPGLITSSGWHAKVSHKFQLEGLVIGITSNPSKKSSAFVQFDGGKITEYIAQLGFAIARGASEHAAVNFSSSCPWMAAVLIRDSESLKPLLIGRDEYGRLQVGGKVLCNNCGSFSFYSNLADQVITHLILSTRQDFLFIVDAVDILHEEIEFKYENFVHTGNRRKDEENVNFIKLWERGAKVIGALHGDDAAVLLETTRGNLECVYPRKLVLASIINSLMQGRFGDALHMVRRHRIDFNVIIDHFGWRAFLQLATEFVKQVNNLSYITEFVCAIKSDNILETLYKSYISLPSQKGIEGAQDHNAKGLDANNKVSSVLLAIRKALVEQVPESPSRELCVLTTLARSDPPALEEALKRIKTIREMELSGLNDPRRVSYPPAEEALKHLLWLSDSEAVFESALGLYDLNLAAIVALNSQRDPKEFLPYLQELEHMPDLIMRYYIDIRLRRFDSALKHIVLAGDAYYSECMDLMNKNPQLFPLGLQLITDPAKRTEVLEAWGDHLSDEKCFEDAATTYLCCSNLEKALKAYHACGNWSGMLTVAGCLKMQKDDIMLLAYELCEELEALGKPGEAAKIALDYCGDVSSGVNLLIKAREWEESLRVAFMHMREDLISEVKRASLECASSLIAEYEEGLEKVGKYLTRYLAVRQRRLLLAAKLQAEERSFNDLDDDAASEASSNFSGMSVYTTGSKKSSAASVSSTVASKARDARRQKSRGKIRPGSPGEELALVEHLKGMSLTGGAKRELKSLLVSLAILGDEDIARKLQRVGENFQLSQMAAVKLAEDTVSSDSINEQAHSLDHYIRKIRTDPQSLEDLSWRSKVFLSP